MLHSAASCTQSYSASLFDSGEASLIRSAEAEYLHSLLKVEALEGSGSRDSMKSRETGEYRGLLRGKETVVADAVAAVRDSEYHACDIIWEPSSANYIETLRDSPKRVDVVFATRCSGQ